MSAIKLNLKVLSQLRPYERLSTIDNRIIVDRPSFFQGIRRWFRGEHRRLNMEVIDRLITRSILYMVSSPNMKLQNILSAELHGAMCGLVNLQKTYENDSLSVARIELLIDEIKQNIVALPPTEDNNVPLLLL